MYMYVSCVLLNKDDFIIIIIFSYHAVSDLPINLWGKSNQKTSMLF